jgi:tetratricopeptide (TPR) repeat protein
MDLTPPDCLGTVLPLCLTLRAWVKGKGVAMSENIRMPDGSTLASEVLRLTRSIEIDSHNTQLYVQRGMTCFRLGDVAASIDDFDRAEHLNPGLTPYLWQRGIAYYYAERFEDGAKQFEADLAVNGHDVEETVWRYLCQAQLQGAHAARDGLLPVRNDPRPVMRWVYQLFAGACTAEQVVTQWRDAGRREHFYCSLYVGLYFEAERDQARARHSISQAADMRVIEDYMGWVAIVHQRLRGWAHC